MCKKVVSVTSFGAIAGKNELQTNEIQSAIDDCFLSGGGTVEIPEGVFFTGGIRLRSNVTLHLLKNAVLKGSRNPEDYFGYKNDSIEPLDAELITDKPFEQSDREEDGDTSHYYTAGSRWNNGLIRAVNAENIAIIGEEGSVIDGSDCYDVLGEQEFRGPHAISMFYCKGIQLKGYTIKNSGNWAHSIFFGKDIHVEKVTVLAGHDGIDCMDCENVLITDCVFYTGDDCVAGILARNLRVKNCLMNTSCNAFRLGGSDVLIEDCKLSGPSRYPFRNKLSVEEKMSGVQTQKIAAKPFYSVFTYYGDYKIRKKQVSENIVIRNCEVENARMLLDYNFLGKGCWQTNNPLSSIRVENIKMSGLSVPLLVNGDKDVLVTAEFENIDIAVSPEFGDRDFIRARYFDRISLKNVTVRGFGSGDAVKVWSDGDVELDNVDCGSCTVKAGSGEFEAENLPI